MNTKKLKVVNVVTALIFTLAIAFPGNSFAVVTDQDLLAALDNALRGKMTSDTVAQLKAMASDFSKQNSGQDEEDNQQKASSGSGSGSGSGGGTPGVTCGAGGCVGHADANGDGKLNDDINKDGKVDKCPNKDAQGVVLLLFMGVPPVISVPVAVGSGSSPAPAPASGGSGSSYPKGPGNKCLGPK